MEFLCLYDKKSRKEHVERVCSLCCEFADSLNCIDKSLLINAAYLHDVAKQIDDDYHHERKYIALALRKKNIDTDKIDRFDDVCIIIENHRGKFFPHRYIWESAILRICDKLDKFNQAKFKAKKIFDNAKEKAEKKGKNDKKAKKKAQKKSDKAYEEAMNEARKSCKASLKKIEHYFDELIDKQFQVEGYIRNFKYAYDDILNRYYN